MNCDEKRQIISKKILSCCKKAKTAFQSVFFIVHEITNTIVLLPPSIQQTKPAPNASRKTPAGPLLTTTYHKNLDN